jgi:hypothetical protein
MDEEILSVVGESICAALRNHAAHIVFQQVRTAPEHLIVHFSAFELNAELQRRWPNRFQVLLEEDRNDVQVVDLEEPNRPFVFEFKVPWSGDLIVGKIVADLIKMSRCAHRERGYVVTVFLSLLETPPWANQRTRRYTVEALEQAVHEGLAQRPPGWDAAIVFASEPIHLETTEARIECTVTLWHPQVPNAPEVEDQWNQSATGARKGRHENDNR